MASLAVGGRGWNGGGDEGDSMDDGDGVSNGDSGEEVVMLTSSSSSTRAPPTPGSNTRSGVRGGGWRGVLAACACLAMTALMAAVTVAALVGLGWGNRGADVGLPATPEAWPSQLVSYVHLHGGGGGTLYDRIEPVPMVFPAARTASARAGGLCAVAAGDGGVDCSPTPAEVIAALAARWGVPSAYIVLYRRGTLGGAWRPRAPTLRLLANDTATSLLAHGIHGGHTMDAYLRPLRGDHIHVAFAMYVHGRRVALTSLHDRPTVGITSEGMHVTNLFPHFGVHGGAPGWFDDGLIHIHPGTAWQWLTAMEGLGCTLGAYLEQVGVLVWEPGSHRYPNHDPLGRDDTAPRACVDAATPLIAEDNGLPLDSNVPAWTVDVYAVNHTMLCATPGVSEWAVYLWDHVSKLDGPPTATVTTGLDAVWLPYSGGVVIMSLQPIAPRPTHPAPSPLPPPWAGLVPHEQSLQILRSTATAARGQGFDGDPYPLLP